MGSINNCCMNFSLNGKDFSYTKTKDDKYKENKTIVPLSESHYILILYLHLCIDARIWQYL